jgi:hypothetical protein
MKIIICLLLIPIILASCGGNNQTDTAQKTTLPIQGTWKLISGTLIEKGDTTVTDYTKDISFIKIINDTHFAFLSHDLHNGKNADSAFSAGGGPWSLKDSLYTEHLQYCNDRQWEGNDFDFTITIKNDTLTQTGIEKVANAGVNRLNIEKYFRLKK